ncbi:hypothetical protein K470DRAFT_192581, partial [Piedraia hortae CBS 480.64]
KQESMADLKLERLNELKRWLQADLDKPRVPVSEAANALIDWTDQEPVDYMVPSRWGKV